MGALAMPFSRKVLWIVSLESSDDERDFAQHADAAGIDTVCIRTDSPMFPGIIGRFHQMQKMVWAWRWPGVIPSDTGTYYALRQAEYVANTLIPKGLDGYIIDPESDKEGPNDHHHDGNDWNQTSLAPIAQEFCSTITKAAQGKPFLFGTTSGCIYPGPQGKRNIPWNEFFGASAALYPQCYWRMTVEENGKDVSLDINGGTPTKAIARGVPVWKARADGKPVIPMAGEIDLATPAEIAEYGQQLTQLNLKEAHFYADIADPVKRVPPAVLAAIKAL
jgi:hypothetical protein